MPPSVCLLLVALDLAGIRWTVDESLNLVILVCFRLDLSGTAGGLSTTDLTAVLCLRELLGPERTMFGVFCIRLTVFGPFVPLGTEFFLSETENYMVLKGNFYQMTLNLAILSALGCWLHSNLGLLP